MNTKITLVRCQKTKTKRIPRIRLAGSWLNDIGFKPESLAIAQYEHKNITIELQGTGLETYKSLIRQIRANHLGLLHITEQYSGKKRAPHLTISGLWLETLGFGIGSVIAVQFEYGSISIKLLKLDELGF